MRTLSWRTPYHIVSVVLTRYDPLLTSCSGRAALHMFMSAVTDSARGSQSAPRPGPDRSSAWRGVAWRSVEGGLTCSHLECIPSEVLAAREDTK